MRIGIDLGGTKIEGIVLEDDGEILFRRRVPTPYQDYQQLVSAIASLVKDLQQDYGNKGSVGIGIPGSASPATGIVRNANTVCLIGNNLQADIEQRIEQPIRLANDADCFALSEARDGAGQGSDCVFGVIIGTGCGSGIVVRGQLLNGPNRIAGEWGHNPLPWPRDDERPGHACYCGQSGCLETFLSGTGFRQSWLDAGGADMHPAEIVKLAENADPLALSVMQDYEDRLARSLAVIINILDPDTIVLGGGMSNVNRLYANIPALWDQYIFSPEAARTRLVCNQHGDSSGVRGAAWLWPIADA